MNEDVLLKRIEEQAVEIAKLKEQLESAHLAIETLNKDMPNAIYRRMANAAVNCGAYYGCSLARRYVD